MSNAVKVKISLINEPNEIYVKFLEGELSTNNDKLRRQTNDYQDQLAGLAKTSKIEKNPIVGEIYGCYVNTWKKWVRGKIILKQNYSGYKIFLVDHGHYKVNINDFIEIPENARKVDEQPFNRASLGLQRPKNAIKWCEKTIKICKEINDKRDELDIRFVAFYEENKVFLGDLYIFEDDKHYSLSEKLLSLNLAEKPQLNFQELFKSMLNKNIGPVPNVKLRKRIEMQKYFKSIKEDPKETVKSNEIVIAGSNLRAAWETVDECQIQNIYKNKLTSLTQLQKNLWPQISVGSHAVVISNETSLTSTYLVPLLNKLTFKKQAGLYPKDLGSRAIIFTVNSDAVDKISKQAEEYTKNLKITRAVKMCEDKKIDILNGCDLLIVTPPAFLRLMKNIPTGTVFKRLKCVVFDNFDDDMFVKLMDSVNLTLKILYKLENIPQTIVASNSVSNFAKNKIISLLPKDNTGIFIDDFLNAAVFTQLSISIEICNGSNDKFNFLVNNANKNHEKTVIVVSDTDVAADLETKLFAKDIKALNCDSQKIAKFWDDSCNNKCILIVTDNVLVELDISKADNLIHYDLPADILLPHSVSFQFTKRFKMFRNFIHGKLTTSEPSTLQTTILLDDENVEQFEGLLNFMATRNLLKDNEKVIENIRQMKETIKCLKCETLCTKMLQFGQCNKFNCQHRHKLSKQDEPPRYLDQIKNVIRFDMISMQGPTTFVISIREYYDNKWIPYDQSQQKLENDMQNFCAEKKSTLALTAGKVGDVYAKYDNGLGKWIRGKMIKRKSSEIVVLRPLDHALMVTEIPAQEKNLVMLPEEFASIKPSVFMLQVLNLIPLDGEDSYSKTDIQTMSENIPRKAFYEAKIDFKIGHVLFASNFEAKVDNKSVFNLKCVHSKLGISEVDKNVSANIEKLAEYFKVASKVDVNVSPKEVKSIEVPKQTQTVNWKQMKTVKSYNITLKHFSSPYSFYVTVNNDENLTLKMALKGIEESMDHKELMEFSAGIICLVQKDNRFLRAKILSVFEDHVSMLLVDYGEIYNCNKNNLFEIPERFLNYDFQAVHCSMVGICPKYNMKIWPSLQVLAIRNLINNYSSQLSLKMRVLDKKRNSCGKDTYTVLLFDKKSKAHLNELAVKKGIASECTVPVNNVCDSESSEDDEYDSDLDSTNDSLIIEMFKQMEKASMKSDTGELLPSCPGKVDSSEFTNTSVSSTVASVAESKMSLNSMFKTPAIEWRQDVNMIYMLVSAKDCEDYSLKLTEETLDVIIKYSDEKFERTLIQLFGLVDEKLCSHVLAGNNVIIRLLKKVTHRTWPRLTLSREKCYNIKFSSESLPEMRIYKSVTSTYSGAPDFLTDNESSEMDENSFSSSDDDFN